MDVVIASYTFLLIARRLGGVTAAGRDFYARRRASWSQ